MCLVLFCFFVLLDDRMTLETFYWSMMLQFHLKPVSVRLLRQILLVLCVRCNVFVWYVLQTASVLMPWQIVCSLCVITNCLVCSADGHWFSHQYERPSCLGGRPQHSQHSNVSIALDSRMCAEVISVFWVILVNDESSVSSVSSVEVFVIERHSFKIFCKLLNYEACLHVCVFWRGNIIFFLCGACKCCC